MTMSTVENTRSNLRFSRIEVGVLILVGIATVTLLFPALPASREHARSRFCQSNLRRLDLAAAQFGETNHTLGPVEWTHQLLPYCQEMIGNGKEETVGFPFPPRPSMLTCPSRPDGSDMPTLKQTPHYLLIMDTESDRRLLDKQWKFRDRPLDVPLGKPVWFVGITLSPEEAERQWRTQAGPHVSGRYNQSDSQGNVTLLAPPESGYSHAQSLGAG